MRGVLVPFPPARTWGVIERHPGGLRQPATVTMLEDEYDRLRMDLAVRTAESLAFARRVASHSSAASHALSTGGGPVNPPAEHHVNNILRLATQEVTRASATDPEPSPAIVLLERAA